MATDNFLKHHLLLGPQIKSPYKLSFCLYCVPLHNRAKDIVCLLQPTRVPKRVKLTQWLTPVIPAIWGQGLEKKQENCASRPTGQKVRETLSQRKRLASTGL
jgi:hypothetical protein